LSLTLADGRQTQTITSQTPVHEDGVNLVARHIARQRPSLFKYATQEITMPAIPTSTTASAIRTSLRIAAA
jgi:hypothetical protein